MKPTAKKFLVNVLILPAAFLSAFSARILSLAILGALFKAWNLTDATFAYAPVWAQRIASMAGNIADVSFLVFLTLPLFVYCGKRSLRFQKSFLRYPLFGILLSFLTVGVFLLFKSVRMPKIRVFPFLGASVLFALTDLLSVSACAYLARQIPGKIIKNSASLRLVLSILLQTIFWILSKSSVSVPLIINAGLSGVLLFFLNQKTESMLPEIFLVFSFRFATRFLFGFPDLGGAYPVSEHWLTGAANGVSHSLLLSLYLFAILIVILIGAFRARTKQKGESHVSQ